MAKDKSPPKMSSLQIDQRGSFFSKLLSKEASAVNSSSRLLYYGGSACSIPFHWETCPGTPKRELTTTSSYSLDSADECKSKPFLTPPPYYSSCSGSKRSENGLEAKVQGGLRFLSMLVRKLGRKRSALSQMFSVSSSKSSSSLSLVALYRPLPGKTKGFGEKYVMFMCSRCEGGGEDNDVVGRDKGSLSSASKPQKLLPDSGDVLLARGWGRGGAGH